MNQAVPSDVTGGNVGGIMKRGWLVLLAGVLLAGCTPAVATLPDKGLVLPATVNARQLAGLPVDVAAHAEVQAIAPAAFALMPDSQPFVQALSRSVEPLRLQLAQSLAADPTIRQGLAGWDRLDTNTRLALLQRVAEFQAQVMRFSIPPISLATSPPPQANLMAVFDPSEGNLGQITLYPAAVARGARYLAVSTLVHELRHAAQYQMIRGDLAVQAADDSDAETLAAGYGAAWTAMDTFGGQSRLSYGDYAHLNVEFDAFQCGNQVATILSQGQFEQVGFGFVDTHYQPNAAPTFNLLSVMSRMAGVELVTSVNAAQAQAERGRAVNRLRHGGTVVRVPVRQIVQRPGRLVIR
jgi:hypothetical protein